MRAARLVGIGEMRMETVERPSPGPGEILVAVEACGICGSDRHMFRGEYPTALPVTLGHEFAGRVVAAGQGASLHASGALVTIDPNVACGHCRACRAGRPNLCDSLTPIGVFRDGGFADFVVVPEAQAIGLTASVSALHGAFSEPLACCLHGLDVARIVPGDTVAVLGGGVIGLLMVQLARLAGAATIILSTRQASRRRLAETLGATHGVDAARADASALIAGPQGIVPGGVDVVLECAGVPETLAQSLALARRGGTVVVFGVAPQGASIAVEPYQLLTKELRVEGAWLNPHTHQRAAQMIADGRLDLDSLITRTVPLGEVPAVISRAPEAGEVKIVGIPD